MIIMNLMILSTMLMNGGVRAFTGWMGRNSCLGVPRRALRMKSSMSSDGKQKVVFLGTPDVAAASLEMIVGASKSEEDLGISGSCGVRRSVGSQKARSRHGIWKWEENNIRFILFDKIKN